MLVKAGPNGDPIATPSTCLKNNSLVAMLSKLQKPCLGMLWGFLLSLYKLLIQILKILSARIFVNQ